MHGVLQFFLVLLGRQPGVAQPTQPSKTYASSYSRGLLSIEKLEEQADSTVERMANPGYVLTDVGIHLNPHSALEVHAQMRIRSEYGGFWGSGLTLDLRQMWIRGSSTRNSAIKLATSTIVCRPLLCNNRMSGSSLRLPYCSPPIGYDSV